MRRSAYGADQAAVSKGCVVTACVCVFAFGKGRSVVLLHCNATLLTRILSLTSQSACRLGMPSCVNTSGGQSRGQQARPRYTEQAAV